MNKQVTSVETSNKLRKLFDAANVQIFSIFFRDWTGAKEDEIEYWGGKPEWCEDNIPCYTTAELGEMLPLGTHSLHIGSRCWDENKEWQCNVVLGMTRKRKIIYGKNEVEARGKMLIYLLENNLLKVAGIN